MYISKSEFIFALTQIKTNEKSLDELKEQLEKCEYKLYSRIKNPNDYDIVGYDSNREAIRSIKSGSRVTNEQKWDYRQKLEEERDDLKSRIQEIEMRVKEAKYTLGMLEEPLKTICELKFVEGKKYEEVCSKLGNMSVSTLFRYVNKELDRIFEHKKRE